MMDYNVRAIYIASNLITLHTYSFLSPRLFSPQALTTYAELVDQDFAKYQIFIGPLGET